MEGLKYIGVWEQYRSVEFTTAEEVLEWAKKIREATKERDNGEKEVQEEEEKVEDPA